MDDILKREEEAQKVKDEVLTELAAINTDDDDEEVSYDLWKIREMKRLKRTREEREQYVLIPEVSRPQSTWF